MEPVKKFVRALFENIKSKHTKGITVYLYFAIEMNQLQNHHIFLLGLVLNYFSSLFSLSFLLIYITKPLKSINPYAGGIKLHLKR